MTEYHKIDSVFLRDPNDRYKSFLVGQYANPAFELLKDVEWYGTEKIDGTNIRVIWDGSTVKFGGRTEAAQIPAKLFEYLNATFTAEKMLSVFGDKGGLVLYGEGYGAGIQSGGGYRPDQSFILFDIAGGDTWFEQEVVNNFANDLDIDMVKLVFTGTLEQAIHKVAMGFDSEIGTAKSEGLVLRPRVELKDRLGHRVITKLKTKDFARNPTQTEETGEG